MKKTWMYALLGITPNLLAWNYALAGPPGQCGERVIVRKSAEPADAAEQGDGFVWVAADSGDVDVEADVIVVGDAQATGDGRSDKKVKQIKVIAKPRNDDPDAAQRGWLGVSIEPVPDSISAQLAAEGRGMMVGNVVTDSPADKAGVQVHDVIVSLNGQEVSGEVGLAVDLIKSLKPGETANVGIVRGGQPLTIKVTLGSRSEMKGMSWKFDTGAQVEEQIKTRGKFIVKSPDGELIVKDLGDLDNLKNLPHNIRMFVPQSGTRSTQVTVENGQKTIKMNVEKDGSTISIEQEDGGPITVRRSDDGGQEVVATYDNEDALEAGDEDAYELYSQAGQSMFVHLDGDEDDEGMPHVFLHGSDPSGQWRIHLEQSLAEAKEAYGEAMEELHENLMELKNQGTFDVQKFHDMFSAQGGQGPGHAFTFNIGKPNHRFHVNADGSIDAFIRKGDSEMSQSFKNETDMAKRRPDLYEKYEAVKAADQE